MDFVHMMRSLRARKKPNPPKAARARAEKARKERVARATKRKEPIPPEEYSSDERPQFDSEDEKWYGEGVEEGAEDAEDQWWSEGHDSHRHRAKKVKETSALDDLFY